MVMEDQTVNISSSSSSPQDGMRTVPMMSLPTISLLSASSSLPKDCNAILTRVLVHTVDRGLTKPSSEVWRNGGGLRPLMAARISVVPDSEVPIPHNWSVPVSVEDDFEKILVGGTGGGEGESGSQPSSSQSIRDSSNVKLKSSGARVFDMREGKDDVDSEGWSGAEHLRKAIGNLSLSPEEISTGWASQIARLAGPQLMQEKRRVKQELKSYDVAFTTVHGRPPGRVDKEPMRPLYTYYRGLKQAIEESEPSTAAVPSIDRSRATIQGRSGMGHQPEEEPSTAASSNRMMMRLQSLIDEKSRIREGLQQYQARFFVENQRKIKYHKDIVPIEREYREYKQVKEEIAQLERKLGIGNSKEHHHHHED
ncbi:conserved hypothetical protein [Perkinsus marinus ATCC 50983]|uniref:FAM13A-like domain-containing protein n=1 Tax=Perkinsus marinus (strain ATCC 50983 / TXsc) TaxID=423536 RepID=C5K8H1_PERM5|nr:conserved hypothetical protein [Perkinsus marinus ATCC 50983]EER19178.1 conserved hypothetical protein [Perkinsus marinus ATCC 50983]|eukprot:XP_002787382.1 conserved hypothetical protein [Perkinsus marinus ATCC 50983]